MQRSHTVLATLPIMDEGIKVSWIPTHVFDLLLWVIFSVEKRKHAYVSICHGRMFKSHLLHITVRTLFMEKKCFNLFECQVPTYLTEMTDFKGKGCSHWSCLNNKTTW